MGAGVTARPPLLIPKIGVVLPAKKSVEEEPATKHVDQEADFAAADLSIQEQLERQDKIRVRLHQVPEDSTDLKLPPQEVRLNGYCMVVPRGVPVDVPQAIYEILEETGHL